MTPVRRRNSAASASMSGPAVWGAVAVFMCSYYPCEHTDLLAAQGRYAELWEAWSVS